MALLYWTRLGAPDGRISEVLGVSSAEVASLRLNLSMRLCGGDAAELRRIAAELSLAGGFWPSPSVPWSERHAVTLIERALAPGTEGDCILAVVAGEGALTRADVAGLVTRIRSGLARHAIGPGSHVAIDATQRFETFLLVLALLLQGAVVVRLGDGIPAETLRSMLRAAPALITFSARHEAIGPLPEAGLRIDLDDAGLPGIPGFAEWFDGQRGEAPAVARLAPGDAALVGFTSGSTGLPKRVRNTHEAVWRSSEVAVRYLGLDATDVFCSATDIVALSGFRSMLGMPLMCGGRVLFLSAAARRAPLAQALECAEHGVTCLTAVPNVLRAFLAAADRIDPMPRLRTVLSGSGVLDVTTAEAWRATFGSRVIDYYAKREIGTCLYSEPGSTMGDLGGRAVETIVRVLDEDGAPVTDGGTGELHVLTDGVMQLDCPSDGTGEMNNGWHATGDLGCVDAAGRIRLTGRKSEIIKTGDGQLLAPIVVETELLLHPAVSDACVFALTSADGRERIGAVVCCVEAAGLGGPDLEKALRSQVLAALGQFCTPDHVLVVAEFPRVGRQKPDRRALRHAYLSAFDGSGHGSRAVKAPQ